MCQILVVDDESDVREVVCEMLTAVGHRAIPAADGDEASRWLTDQHPDRPCLVVLDLRMPNLDGWDFLERLRRDYRWVDLPVIVLSATVRFGEPPPVVRAQAFWAKPPLDEQMENIQNHCPRHRRSPLAVPAA
jgi:CheY-like chemotaxis protein